MRELKPLSGGCFYRCSKRRQQDAKTLALTADTAPRNDIEQQLIALFEDVLQVKGIGITDKPSKPQ